MKDVQSYDGDLRMFREAPRAVDLARLRFLRWLAEQGRLEHPVAGAPSGPLAAVRGAPQPAAEVAGSVRGRGSLN